MEDIVSVARRLFYRALSTVYMSVGFFLTLAWVWEDYIGVVVIAIAYVVASSILYSHVFRPLVKYREILSMVGRHVVNVYKVLGFTASIFGFLAILLMILSNYLDVSPRLVPLFGIVATVVSIVLLLVAVTGSPKLFGAPEILTIILLASSIIIYILKPSLVLPIMGASFLGIGMYTYWLYYLKTSSGG